MNGTNYSTAGLRRITAWDTIFKWRLVIFTVVIVLGLGLVAWIKTSTWRRVGVLEQKFAAIQTDRFSLAIELRIRTRKVHEALLDYFLERTVTNQNRLLEDVRDLQSWLAAKRLVPTTAPEVEALRAAVVLIDQYLANARRLVTTGDAESQEATFSENYKKCQTELGRVLLANDRLLTAQNEAWNRFIADSEKTLLELQDLLKLSVGLLLILAAVAAVIGYRGVISPLRFQLSESHAAVERQEKLASLGVLASGVAHEIRNPLTAIKFRLFSLNKSFPQLAENEDAKVVSDEINRLERIVKDFLRFARPSEPVLACLPAESILRQVSDLLKSQLQDSAIDLKLEATGPAWVQADFQQFEQVLINLVQNSAESIVRDGTIILRIRKEDCRFADRTRPGVIFEVTDTGKGIPPEVEKRLFDPFFTTRESGTGLGLPVVARIVEKHGGVLRYRTVLNRGTTFEIVLPESESHASDHSAH